MAEQRRFIGEIGKLCINLMQKAPDEKRYDSRASLAKAIGATRSQITKWFDYGESPAPKSLERILKLLAGISLNQMVELLTISVEEPALLQDLINFYKTASDKEKSIFREIVKSFLSNQKK